MFRRIFLFIATNLAILLTISVIFSIFNVKPYLTPYGINYQSLLVFATIIGFAGSFISLLISKWMAKRAYRIQIIKKDNSEYVWLFSTVQKLAEQAHIGMPEVGIYESAEANAFATGARRDSALVAISTGLLDGLNKKEAEAVLAHEISHIANGDMITMALMQGVLNTFVIFFARIVAYIVQTALRDDGESMSTIAYYFTSIIFELIFGIFASMILMWFSRKREYRADAGAASLTGTPESMIAALKKLEIMIKQVKAGGNKSYNTMKIADRQAWLKLFSSHPSTKQRVAALRAGLNY